MKRRCFNKKLQETRIKLIIRLWKQRRNKSEAGKSSAPHYAVAGLAIFLDSTSVIE